MRKAGSSRTGTKVAAARRARDSIRALAKKSAKQSNLNSDFWYVNPSDQSRVINPRSPYMKRWDIIMMLMLVYTALLTPFEISFLTPTMNALFFANRFIDLLFYKDLVMRFRIMYYDNKTNLWVTRQSEITKRYLKGWFLIDFLSVLPFDILGLYMNSPALSNLKVTRVFRLFRLLKLLRMIRGASIFQRWESKMTITYGLLSLVKFGVIVLTLAHWGACASRILVDLENFTDEEGNPYNWMTEYKTSRTPIGEETIQNQYIAALYYSIMTLTTIGYGDVVPKTHGERALAILNMLVGGGIYAYVIGGVCQIVTSMDVSTNQFHQLMDNLNRYIDQNNLPEHLKTRLKEYFHNSRHIQQEHHYKELLRTMSPGLRGEVSLHNHRWIHKISFFRCGDPIEQCEFIIGVALRLRAACFSPQEVVIRRNDYNTKMYLVERGLASGSKGEIISRGSFFGEDIILHLQRRKFSMVALTYLHAQILYKIDLEELLATGCYPQTNRAIRRHTVKVAFQKRFVKFARLVELKGKMARMQAVTTTGTNSQRIKRRSDVSFNAPLYDEDRSTPLASSTGMEERLVGGLNQIGRTINDSVVKNFASLEKKMMSRLEEMETRISAIERRPD